MDPWRLILDPPMGGAENMAVDEAILRSTEAYVEACVEQMGTLRLYSWKEPTLSIGYMQKAGPFLKRAEDDEERVPFVRRITGGRAVLHDCEITYSLIVPATHPLYTQGIDEAYRVVSLAIVEALKEVNIDASFTRGSLKRGDRARRERDACFLTTSRYEVTAGSKKIAGSAQRRFKGAFLQHGSILLNIDKTLTERLFGTGVVEDIASVSDFTDVASEGIDLIKGEFIERLGDSLEAEFFVSKLSAPEYCMKEELIEEKYSRIEWNERGGGGLNRRK